MPDFRVLILLVGIAALLGAAVGSTSGRHASTDVAAAEESRQEHTDAGKTCVLSPASPVATHGDKPGAAVYVSPHGRDTWSGALPQPNADLTDGPFAGLEKARDAARTDEAVTRVVIRGGDYYLEKPVEFDVRDSGLVIEAAAGERPVFHGGIPVTGWSRDPDGAWSAPLALPDGTALGDFFIGSEKQIRARHPNRAPRGGARDGWLFAAAPDPKAGPWSGNMRFRFHDGDVPNLRDPMGLTADVVGGFHPGSQWGSDVLPVVSIDYATNTVHTQGTAYFFTGEGSRYFLAGHEEFLDAPGEWWYDGLARRLRYIPADNGFDGSAAVAGLLPTLFKLDGAAGMVISGLAFLHGAPDGSGKYGTDTRGFGALRIQGADRARLVGNVFCHLGVGIHVSESNDVMIAANEIGHTAGNGIYLGTTYDGLRRSDRARIVGNHIHDVSEVFIESAGLWFQASTGTRIAYNLIESAAQFGIAGGSLWGRQDACYDNVIEYNIVRGANQRTADGGAIKMMGEQGDRQESVIRYNLVTGTDHLMNRSDGTFWPSGYENVDEWPTPISWAIYTDGRASGIRIESNLVLGNVSGIGLNGGWNNVVTGNVVAGGTGTAFRIDDGTGRSWRPDWAQANRFESNIVGLDHENSAAVHVHAPGHGSEFVDFKGNLYWGQLSDRSFHMPMRGGQQARYGSLADFQRNGDEVGSRIADPLFRDFLDGDAIFSTASPVWNLGFKDIPIARIGPTGFDACRYGLC